jgi:hypothetical protein
LEGNREGFKCIKNLQKCKQIIFAVTGFHFKIVIIRGHNDFRQLSQTTHAADEVLISREK